MSRTFADMTPAERAECVGRWATVPTERRLVIITGAEGATVRWVDPGHSQRWGMSPGSSTTPRFDLPRAWTPSGEPVPGTWDDDNGHNLMRRFQSEWEWKPDTPQHIIDQHTKETP